MTNDKTLSVAFLISFIGHCLFISILELSLYLFPKDRIINYITINFEMKETVSDAIEGEKYIRRIAEKPIQPELKQQFEAKKKIVRNISKARVAKEVNKINPEMEKSVLLSDAVDKIKKNQAVEERLMPPKPEQQHKLEEIATHDFSKQTSKDNNGVIDKERKEMSLYQEGTSRDIKTTYSSGGVILGGKSGLAGSEKEAIVRYQDMVRLKIEQAKIYPLWAKKQGIEGITHICFNILPDGTGQNVKVVRSSGSSILDEEAIATVKRANPFPPVPQKISRTLVRIELAIVFSLKKN